MSSRDTFFGPFDNEFRSLALASDAEELLPFVMARPVDDPHGDELAEFRAGALVAPARGAEPLAWRIDGLLHRASVTGPIVGSVTVRHFPLDDQTARAEVTGTVLRGLPLATIRERALRGLEGIRQARDAMAETGWSINPASVERARDAADEARKPRPGRPGLPDEHFARIAGRYIDLVESGLSNVLVALAEEESQRAGRTIPRETIRDWVRKATERGYLAPGKPGKAEARPGPKLKRKGK
jgi:hypothetical protein